MNVKLIEEREPEEKQSVKLSESFSKKPVKRKYKRYNLYNEFVGEVVKYILKQKKKKDEPVS